MTDDAKQKEAAAELEKRMQAFNAELIPLLGKYELGLGAEPNYARTPQGVFVTIARPILLDARKKPEDKAAEVAVPAVGEAPAAPAEGLASSKS